MNFIEITNNRELFQNLMVRYYREGEDADTPQAEIDEFIGYLYKLCCEKEIQGVILKDHGNAIGFVLWYKDTEGSCFSNIPGCGTILEIGVQKEFRGNGFGKNLVRYAENKMREMGLTKLYVCAYGPTSDFWAKNGYAFSGKIAVNGLNIFEKNI